MTILKTLDNILRATTKLAQEFTKQYSQKVLEAASEDHIGMLMLSIKQGIYAMSRTLFSIIW